MPAKDAEPAVSAHADPGRTLLLVNRGSRRGRELDLDTVRAALSANGAHLVEPEGDEETPVGERIRRAVGGIDRVVLGGGDGTMNAAAEALVEAALPLGVLPLGTGNDLARTLGLPDDPLAAAAVIARGRTRRIDLARANDKLFFNVANVGLAVQIAEELTGEMKKRWGRLSYPLTAWRVLHRYKSFRARMVCGGQDRSLRALQVAVGNGRFYGGGMTVNEDASIDDGRLDVYVLRSQSIGRLIRRALHLHRGRHDDPNSVATFEGPRAELTTRPVLPVSTDGEVTTRTPVTFTVLRHALAVYVP